MSQNESEEINLSPKMQTVYKTLGVFIGLSAASLISLLFIRKIPDDSLAYTLMTLAVVILFFSLLISYRLIRSSIGESWLNISYTGIRDSFGLLRLKNILNYDIKALQLQSIAGQDFIVAKINPNSKAFKDLDEPKGLLVDFYNVFFKGRVFWPLVFFEYDQAQLKTQLSGMSDYYKEHMDSLSQSQIGMTAKPLIVKKPDIKDPEPSEVPADLENQKKVRTGSVITGLMDLLKHEASPMDITSKADAEGAMPFARNLCEAYFDSIRMLPRWAAQPQTLIPEEITAISVDSLDSDEEYTCFKFKGSEWKIGIEMTPGRERSLLHVFVDLRKVFTCEIVVEIGTLEPVKIIQSTTGPWQQDSLELLDVIRAFPAVSI